jgi:hypothetical protein
MIIYAACMAAYIGDKQAIGLQCYLQYQSQLVDFAFVFYLPRQQAHGQPNGCFRSTQAPPLAMMRRLPLQALHDAADEIARRCLQKKALHMTAGLKEATCIAFKKA